MSATIFEGIKNTGKVNKKGQKFENRPCCGLCKHAVYLGFLEYRCGVTGQKMTENDHRSFCTRYEYGKGKRLVTRHIALEPKEDI